MVIINVWNSETGMSKIYASNYLTKSSLNSLKIKCQYLGKLNFWNSGIYCQPFRNKLNVSYLNQSECKYFFTNVVKSET